MWVSGIMQGLMWRAVNTDGTLTYNFVQELVERQPFYAIRLLGGVVFFAGMVLMAFNVYKTIVAERDTHGDDNVLQAA
jgi:cytochrome c oxidase cbb3-type subunit 1